MPVQKPDELYKELLLKYQSKIKGQMSGKANEPIRSREYEQFRKEILPKHYTFYEKLCNASEKLVKIRPDAKKEAGLNEVIKISHLNITPTGVMSLAIVAPISLMLIGIFFSIIIPTLYGAGPSTFFILFFMAAGAAIIAPLGKLPYYFANNWRMKASNQMVLCTFYVVTYMRHTSNLELAIDFAAEHLAPPLSMDLKKVLWDVEAGRYASVKDSMDAYIETWKKWNPEFVEVFHLIESSLYASNENARLTALNKALSVMLEETYEKMLHYAQELKSPITMLNMLGVVMPILGLVILPLVVNFMEGVKWYHIALLYNIILPITIYYLAVNILSTRPTGYGDTDISDTNPELKKYKNAVIKLGNKELFISPKAIAIAIFIFFFLIGISPLLIHAIAPNYDYPDDFDLKPDKRSAFHLIEYKEAKSVNAPAGQKLGPYGLGASILSIGMVLAFGISFGIYYKLKSQNIIKIREDTKKLEQEFASALFQLGNRLGDNLPAEIAFGRVAEVTQGTLSGQFFNIVSMNIKKLGMSVSQAIFDPKIGAIKYFPSSLIESSMKVMTEGVKKGPLVASQALISVSEYIKEIHRVDERLKDLLSDVISSMQSQINFLTPVIAGIVVGISSMITMILGKLSDYMSVLKEQTGGAGGNAAGMASFTSFFGDSIPTYYMQIIIGLYVVQVVFILVVLSNGIENGADKLGEEYNLGQKLIRTTIVYCIVTLAVILIFNLIASQILSTTLSG